jgi:hypothetical protein
MHDRSIVPFRLVHMFVHTRKCSLTEQLQYPAVWGETKSRLKSFVHYIVMCRGDLDWMLDLFTTYTHDS